MPVSSWLDSQDGAPSNQGFVSRTDLRRMLRRRVFEKITPAELIEKIRRSKSAVREELIEMVDGILAEEGHLLTEDLRLEMRSYIADEILGFGPIEMLLQDPEVEEVMVNSHEEVWAARRREGRVQIELTPARFDDDEHVLHVIERIIGPLGRRVDESNPRVDARLPDGSRVNVVIPPIALKGPTITIRKFPEIFLTMHDLIHRFNSVTEEAALFLEACVKGRLNVIISGGTGSGKTTLLNALSSYIPDGERIVTIEDTAELQLHKYKPHVVRLEARPPNLEGEGAVTIRDLVVNSLRMRPDRIVVGECRSGETVDMLQAMNTGHDGSLTTVHANSPDEAVFRIENMFLMSGIEVPIPAIRQQISMAVHLIVQQQRLRDGSRKITDVAEIVGMDGDRVASNPLFRLVDGRLQDCGNDFKRFEDLSMSREELPALEIFERALASKHSGVAA